MLGEINSIYHHIAEGIRESRVSKIRNPRRGLAESWVLQIMDTRIEFPGPFRNVMIDYLSLSLFIFYESPMLTSF